VCDGKGQFGGMYCWGVLRRDEGRKIVMLMVSGLDEESG